MGRRPTSILTAGIRAIAEPVGRVGADGVGQPARQSGIDLGDHGALLGVVEGNLGQGVIGAGIRGPERSDALVVLDHEIKNLMMVGLQPCCHCRGESAEHVSSLLGGALVVPTCPCGRGGLGVIEVRVHTRAEARCKIGLELACAPFEAHEELLVLHAPGALNILDRPVDGADGLIEARTFGPEALPMLTQETHLVGVSVEQGMDVREWKSQFAQQQDALEPEQLLAAVPAIPVRADPGRAQQADIVVVTQGAGGDAGHACDIANRAFHTLTLAVDLLVTSTSSVMGMSLHEPFTIGNVRPVSAGRTLSATHVRVENGTITAVGDSSITQEADVRIDGRGEVLMPGLIDSHVHLLPGSTQLAAIFGVTTVIDMFSKPEIIEPERELVAASDGGWGLAAADVRTSSIGATAPGGHPTLAYSPFPYVTGPQDAEPFVAGRIAEGANHLKIIYDDGSGAMLDIPALSVVTIEALVEAAHRHDLVVSAHVSTARGSVTMARAGVDVLAHAPMDRMTAEQIQEIAAAGVAVIPTLSITDGFPGSDGVMALLGEPRLAARLPTRWCRVVERQAKRWMPPQAPDGRAQRDNVAALHEAGVLILAGTDAPNPGLVHGASLHRELQHLVAAGLTPHEALASATSVPAQVFGLTDRGVIRVGARADLVLTSGDPTSDIATSASITQVWVRGRELDESVYPGSDLERDGVMWLRDSAAKIMQAIQDTWPGIPCPEDIFRDDGELLGRVVPQANGWQPTTSFGAALGDVTDHDHAVEIVHARGLSSLAESWWIRSDGSDQWLEAELLEVAPDRLRIRWKDPMLDQPPSGQWMDIDDIDISGELHAPDDSVQ